MALSTPRPWFRFLQMFIAALSMCMIPLASSAQSPTIIRLSVDNPPGNDRAAVEQKFADLVRQLSKGRLQVTIYWNGSLGGSEATAIQSLKAGGAEMAIVGTANYSRFDSRWNLFDLPFLFSGPDGLYKFMQATQFQQLTQNTIDKNGLRYIFPYYDGWRQLVTTKKQVRTLPDEAGLKLRATPSAVEHAYDAAFGAKPTSVAWNETYLALKQGLVDGFMIGYTDLIDFKMGDAVGFGTTLNVAPELVCGFMRENFFQSLPKDLQVAVLTAGRQTDIFAQATFSKEERAARADLVKLGVKLYDPPAAARNQWVAAARPVYGQFRDILSEAQQTAIQQARR